MKVIIIGHGPGGMTASGTLRIWDRTAEITNIDTKDFDLYHPCATPYVIGGKFQDLGNGDAIKEDIPYEKMKIKHLHRHLVEKIDRTAKKVQVRNLNTDERFELEYDKIILATGSYNTSPPIPGVKEGKNVFSLKWLEEAEEIRLAAEKAKKVVVIGASAIALEVGCELAERGLDVTIFVRSRVLRQAVDPDYSKLIVNL
ncbi:MAG: FAD-dependent oxidoreductase, partial [Candidatus Heimdallarchaeota archaeon]|nr:FAD-dependent oxidoreductase [Candidatus Heimdallarchaeota archaeon]